MCSDFLTNFNIIIIPKNFHFFRLNKIGHKKSLAIIQDFPSELFFKFYNEIVGQFSSNVFSSDSIVVSVGRLDPPFILLIILEFTTAIVVFLNLIFEIFFFIMCTMFFVLLFLNKYK